ncbi:DUF1259 domain-containing protein [Falsibacillus pallidus]|uniref:Uncharacterized protein DUF1259 n=1 Tax=Falsibacillus pallidus TaxID=493781 RepID=A0A370GPD2_9BACI|nr:DUF1259 domain-containing protein [Falsibacillus pallidus]RDI45537.1 uncharacterized protein DUF1259 [Falsibacillus pallidus]
MNHFQSICHQFGEILKGKPSVENGVCSVQLPRNFTAAIQGKQTKGALHAGFSFESLDAHGNALNLGEIAILEEEIHGVIGSLQSNGILISALHNHWLFTNPSVLYLHFQSVEPPLSFAHKSAAAMKHLKY